MKLSLVKKPPVIYTYRVIEPIENRVSAKIADQFIEDLTPESEKIKLDLSNSSGIGSQRKRDRPTNKKREKTDR